MMDNGEIIYVNGVDKVKEMDRTDILPLKYPPIPKYIARYFKRLEKRRSEMFGIHPILLGKERK